MATEAKTDNHHVISLTAKYINEEDDNRDFPQIGSTTGGHTRSIIPIPISASIYNKVVSVIFEKSFSNVTINILNDETDEVVYTQNYSCPSTSEIDLSTISNGNFTIEIITDKVYLEGNFSL